jgi:hypothetical protein
LNYLYPGSIHGNSEELHCWTEDRGCYRVCKQWIVVGVRLFCAHLSSKCRIWNLSQKLGVAAVTPHWITMKFQFLDQKMVMNDMRDEGRFPKAQNGHNLVNPFQCDMLLLDYFE